MSYLYRRSDEIARQARRERERLNRLKMVATNRRLKAPQFAPPMRVAKTDRITEEIDRKMGNYADAKILIDQYFDGDGRQAACSLLGIMSNHFTCWGDAKKEQKQPQPSNQHVRDIYGVDATSQIGEVRMEECPKQDKTVPECELFEILREVDNLCRLPKKPLSPIPATPPRASENSSSTVELSKQEKRASEREVFNILRDVSNLCRLPKILSSPIPPTPTRTNADKCDSLDDQSTKLNQRSSIVTPMTNKTSSPEEKINENKESGTSSGYGSGRSSTSPSSTATASASCETTPKLQLDPPRADKIKASALARIYRTRIGGPRKPSQSRKNIRPSVSKSDHTSRSEKKQQNERKATSTASEIKSASVSISPSGTLIFKIVRDPENNRKQQNTIEDTGIQLKRKRSCTASADCGNSQKRRKHEAKKSIPDSKVEEDTKESQLKNYDFKTNGNFQQEAINRKRDGDGEPNGFRKISLYLEAVLYFMHSEGSSKSNVIHDGVVWTNLDTLELAKLISSKIRHLQNSSTKAQQEIYNKMNILSLRCQSLISLMLYKSKDALAHDLRNKCDDYFRNENSNVAETKDEGGKLLPSDINAAIQKQSYLITYLMDSHDLWDEADAFVKRGNFTDFFVTLDRENGPLTMHSSAHQAFQYVQSGLKKITEEMRPLQ